MINIKNLYKSFGKNEVLKGITLDFQNGGITAILGPNGSGKTTLIKCLLGLVFADKGEITFKNKSTLNQFQYRNEISHLPQIARFPENLTTRELITMIKDLRKGKTKEDYFIKMFGLEIELDKKMVNLSGGTRQKVNIMLALMYDNPVIILDEPSTGLDPLALINLKAYLLKERDKGKLILITTHIMSFVEEIADDIAFLLEGHVYFYGPLAELLKIEEEVNLERAIAHILTPKKVKAHA